MYYLYVGIDRGGFIWRYLDSSVSQILFLRYTCTNKSVARLRDRDIYMKYRMFVANDDWRDYVTETENSVDLFPINQVRLISQYIYVLRARRCLSVQTRRLER